MTAEDRLDNLVMTPMRFEKLSKTELEVKHVHEKYIRGRYTPEEYEEAVDCILFWANVSPEEEKRLREKYT